MSREIKFRAWKDDIKRFKYFDLKSESECEYTNFCLYGGDPEQYTGLKDKNGKEIYEGDIVNKGYLNYEVIDEIGAVKLGILSDSDGYYHHQTMGWKAGDNSLLMFMQNVKLLATFTKHQKILGQNT